MTKPGSYLGRGYESIPGKSFQWAWYQEREEIRQHLQRRLWRFLPRDGLPMSVIINFRITKIQERIHKYKPTFADRCKAFNARQPQRAPTPSFTDDELTHLIELFAHANDPVSRSIALKAAEILQRR